MIENGKVNAIIGGQWGSEGKGKLAGIICGNHPEVDVAISDFTPNAGHTWIGNDGRKFVSKIFPTGSVFPSVRTVLIGPHAVFSLERFFEERDQLYADFGREPDLMILVHPMAVILDAGDAAREYLVLNRIASTMQGSAVAYQRKVMRSSAAHLAKHESTLHDYLGDTQEWLQDNIGKCTALMESAQGFDLGLNCGHVWPYVTGRDCLVGRMLDNAGVSPKLLGYVTAAIRTFPIRVGNVPDGSSGSCHHDQYEISWDDVSKGCGKECMEMTTVTKRIRRVFTWSDEQIIRFLRTVRPDFAFLNFTNYWNAEDRFDRIKKVADLLKRYGCKLEIVGYGPKQGEYLFVDDERLV